MLWCYKHSVHLLNSLVFCTCSSCSLCLSIITGIPSSLHTLHMCTVMIDRSDFVLAARWITSNCMSCVKFCLCLDCALVWFFQAMLHASFTGCWQYSVVVACASYIHWSCLCSSILLQTLFQLVLKLSIVKCGGAQSQSTLKNFEKIK